MLDKILSSQHPAARMLVLSICAAFMWAFIFVWSTVMFVMLMAALGMIGVKMEGSLTFPETLWFTLCVLVVRALCARIGSKR